MGFQNHGRKIHLSLAQLQALEEESNRAHMGGAAFAPRGNWTSDAWEATARDMWGDGDKDEGTMRAKVREAMYSGSCRGVSPCRTNLSRGATHRSTYKNAPPLLSIKR